MAAVIEVEYRNRMRVFDFEGNFLFEYFVCYTSREKQMRGWAGWSIFGKCYCMASCDMRTSVLTLAA